LIFCPEREEGGRKNSSGRKEGGVAQKNRTYPHREEGRTNQPVIKNEKQGKKDREGSSAGYVLPETGRRKDSEKRRLRVKRRV